MIIGNSTGLPVVSGSLAGPLPDGVVAADHATPFDVPIVDPLFVETVEERCDSSTDQADGFRLINRTKRNLRENEKAPGNRLFA